MSEDSFFANAIRRNIERFRPDSVLETGTYEAKGTTRILWNAMKDFVIQPNVVSHFHSIEVNPRLYGEAIKNACFEGNGVRIHNGLTLWGHQLPSPEAIEADIQEVEMISKERPIYIDHEGPDRGLKYAKETAFPYVPENLMLDLMEKYSPQFILLDSGAHIGYLEFRTMVANLKKSCVIAMDDIFHFKHFRSWLWVLKDSRFKVLESGDEKFGYGLALFEP